MSVSIERGSDVLRLRRVLSVWDLILYGIVAVTPSAPATVFGLAELRSHGHAVVTILAAMVAMVLTAISYGRMAALYPSAGSAYTYVGRGLHPYLGFVSGWAMLLASALAFGFVHIIFRNWLAVGLCVIGGLLFSLTYHSSGSLLLACLDHAIFGNFLFTIGLGEFFYHRLRT